MVISGVIKLAGSSHRVSLVTLRQTRETRSLQSLTDITRAAGELRFPATKAPAASLMKQASHKAEQLALARKFHALRKPVQRDKNGRFSFTGGTGML